MGCVRRDAVRRVAPAHRIGAKRRVWDGVLAPVMPTRLSRRQLVLAAFALAVSACADGTATPIAEPVVASFDRMWATVDREYSYFDYKGIDWLDVRRKYRPRAQRASTTAELVAIAHEALGALRDVHVWIIAPGGGAVATYQPAHRRNWSPLMLARARQRDGWMSGSSAIGAHIVDGVPVVVLTSFAPGQWHRADFDRLLERFREAPALVLDVRMNGGGSDALAYEVAGRFTATSRTGGYYQFRRGLRHDAFTPMAARAVVPRGDWQFTRPVVLLTGRGSFSATEGFVSALRTLPNVVVVGDTTGGGSGNPSVFPLRDGYGISVSRWIEYTADRVPIEGRGIAPDRVVPHDPGAVAAGEDETLAAALVLARQLASDVDGAGTSMGASQSRRP